MHSARPNQSQMRGRFSAVECFAPSETSKAPAQARAIFEATRYPGAGIRGIGSSLARAVRR